MHSKTFFSLIFLVIGLAVGAQNVNKITIPDFHDKYSDFVRRLELGENDIDYKDFRISFLDSRQFQIKLKSRAIFDSLKRKMFLQANKSDYSEVIRFAKALLSIDYTCLYAQKYLQQTYKILGDTANRRKYHDIEFGLIQSITDSGDGKACETSWEVIQIEEEYFLLAMMGDQLKQQSLIKFESQCFDKMEVNDEEGKSKIYYFGINRLMAKYPK